MLPSYCIFYKSKAGPSTSINSSDSLYHRGLDPNPQYLRGVPVVETILHFSFPHSLPPIWIELIGRKKDLGHTYCSEETMLRPLPKKTPKNLLVLLIPRNFYKRKSSVCVTEAQQKNQIDFHWIWKACTLGTVCLKIQTVCTFEISLGKPWEMCQELGQCLQSSWKWETKWALCSLPMGRNMPYISRDHEQR